MSDLLKRFTKEKPETEPKTVVSVNIEVRHQDWLREKQINLSALVRALIDKIMRGEDVDLD